MFPDDVLKQQAGPPEAAADLWFRSGVGTVSSDVIKLIKSKRKFPIRHEGGAFSKPGEGKAFGPSRTFLALSPFLLSPAFGVCRTGSKD